MGMIYQSKNITVFLLLVALIVLLTCLTNLFLISDTLYYNTLIEQLSVEKIESIIEQSRKWAWVGYLLVPIIYYLKFLLVALVLQTGFFFFDRKVSFSIIFKAVMLAEIPFLVVPVIKLFWFLFIQTHYTLNDLQYFFPLSALQLFDVQKLPSWQVYPLQLMNVFELIYWVLLAYWLKKLLNLSLNKSMEVVASSYGTGLLLWVAFITFISLNLAP
ncbi:hypothetical protein [Flectobacillus rivi]|uniref:Yip1 domain-containing protein n=1 Tax=Flectobacillus rivi TaxID=2984209 RepID=A0ABT6Z541_9BACT|nr:hypothetical protein [Flectobacillus rivi]MDI9876238.1 hypothetical protein [Flectobacillus rivi]